MRQGAETYSCAIERRAWRRVGYRSSAALKQAMISFSPMKSSSHASGARESASHAYMCRWTMPSLVDTRLHMEDADLPPETELPKRWPPTIDPEVRARALEETRRKEREAAARFSERCWSRCVRFAALRSLPLPADRLRRSR